MPQYIGSTTPINASQTYTSQWVWTDGNFDTLGGSIFADQAGTLFVEQSGDGVHADISASQALTANQGASFQQNILLPWVRVRVTNTSVTNQTVLRLDPRFQNGDLP